MNATIAELRRANPVNIDDLRRVNRNPRSQVRRQVVRAPNAQQGEDKFGDFEDVFEEIHQRRREPRARVEDDNISSIKMKIPSFKETRDPDVYLN